MAPHNPITMAPISHTSASEQAPRHALAAGSCDCSHRTPSDVGSSPATSWLTSSATNLDELALPRQRTCHSSARLRAIKPRAMWGRSRVGCETMRLGPGKPTRAALRPAASRPATTRWLSDRAAKLQREAGVGDGWFFFWSLHLEVSQARPSLTSARMCNSSPTMCREKAARASEV